MMNASYSVEASTEAFMLCTWRFDAVGPSTASVIPDGCRDLIVEQLADGRARAFVSCLDATRYQVRTLAGAQMRGIRLKPGVLIDEPALRAFLAKHDAHDLLVNDRVEEFCHCPPGLTECLAVLAETSLSVVQAAKLLGVSIRSLQRVVRQGTGQSPGFWRALARARQAGGGLRQFDRLVDVASAYQYADQAHLSREMRRWFGLTPTAIARDDQLLAMLAEPGYGTSG